MIQGVAFALAFLTKSGCLDSIDDRSPTSKCRGAYCFPTLSMMKAVLGAPRTLCISPCHNPWHGTLRRWKSIHSIVIIGGCRSKEYSAKLPTEGVTMVRRSLKGTMPPSVIHLSVQRGLTAEGWEESNWRRTRGMFMTWCVEAFLRA